MSLVRTLRGFLAGAALVNAIPHGYAGATGTRFPSPFARPPGRGLSSPATNLAWSAANAAAGHVLAHPRTGAAPSRVAVFAGAAVMAVGLSWYFTRGPGAQNLR